MGKRTQTRLHIYLRNLTENKGGKPGERGLPPQDNANLSHNYFYLTISIYFEKTLFFPEISLVTQYKK
jgi:hypothetical protein